MTIEQTRQLGIEFERRLQEISPQYKVIDKLDTETIYSFLNEFQDTYVKLLYLTYSQLDQNTTAANKVNDFLGTLITTDNTIAGTDNAEDNCYTQSLPIEYLDYIRSTSIASKTYKCRCANGNTVKMTNKMVKDLDVNQFIESFCNRGGILRNPIAYVEGNNLKVLHDSYTVITKVNLTYLKKPKAFSILTDTACELPFSCFDELVSGAVQLYITNYKMIANRQRQQPRERVKELEAE